MEPDIPQNSEITRKTMLGVVAGTESPHKQVEVNVIIGSSAVLGHLCTQVAWCNPEGLEEKHGSASFFQEPSTVL